MEGILAISAGFPSMEFAAGSTPASRPGSEIAGQRMGEGTHPCRRSKRSRGQDTPKGGTTNMSESKSNKYREAIEILLRGREVLVEELADEILAQSDDLIEGGYAFNEFLEGQGTRIHFLGLLVSQLEQAAEALD